MANSISNLVFTLNTTDGGGNPSVPQSTTADATQLFASFTLTVDTATHTAVGANPSFFNFDIRETDSTFIGTLSGPNQPNTWTAVGDGTFTAVYPGNSLRIDLGDFVGGGLTFATNQELFDSFLILRGTFIDPPNEDIIINSSAVRACFQKGTHILTSEGEKPVELLRQGDLVISAKTGKSVPIKAMLGFLGTQANCPLYCLPKDALGENKPKQDLFLSSRHRVSFDGQLRHMVCLAGLEKSVPTGKAQIEYYHIELADCFDTVIAEGLEVETFIDPRVVAHDWECTGACCTYIPIGPQPISTLVEPLTITA
jgi:hypothetical protein